MWSGSSIVGRSALVERQRVCLSPVGGAIRQSGREDTRGSGTPVDCQEFNLLLVGN